MEHDEAVQLISFGEENLGEFYDVYQEAKG